MPLRGCASARWMGHAVVCLEDLAQDLRRQANKIDQQFVKNGLLRFLLDFLCLVPDQTAVHATLSALDQVIAQLDRLRLDVLTEEARARGGDQE